MRPIESRDTVVFIDDIPVRGCISYDLQGSLELFGQANFGERQVSDYLLNAPQTHPFSIDWYLTTTGTNTPDSLIVGLPSGVRDHQILSSGDHNFLIRDTAEQILVSGAYLTRFLSMCCSKSENLPFYEPSDCWYGKSGSWSSANRWHWDLSAEFLRRSRGYGSAGRWRLEHVR